MEIRRFESDLLSSNMYLIVEGDHGIVIDPCRDTAPAEGLVIDYILLTLRSHLRCAGVEGSYQSQGPVQPGMRREYSKPPAKPGKHL